MGKWLLNLSFIAPHTYFFSDRCWRQNGKQGFQECVHTLQINPETFTGRLLSWLANKERRPAAFIRLACPIWYDQESLALKGNSQCLWEAAAHGLFRQRCVSLSLTRGWWEILRIVCVFVEGEKRDWVSVCQIADVVVCECVKLRREFMRWHLVSCLTFPVSQGSSFKNNAEEKPPTTDNWNATKKKKKKKKKTPGAVCWWLNYCRSSRLETEGEMCEWLYSACSRHISPTGLLYPSISQHSSQ